MDRGVFHAVTSADLLDILAPSHDNRIVMAIRYLPSTYNHPETHDSPGKPPETDPVPPAVRHEYPQIGRLFGFAAAGDLVVELEGQEEPVVARNATSFRSQELEMAVTARAEAVVIFEKGDPGRPVVVGLLAGSRSDGPESRREVRTSQVMPALKPGVQVEADADGERVRLCASKEVVIQCGKASITLRRNGRVVIQGTYIETHATGTNRVKGGNVRIN